MTTWGWTSPGSPGAIHWVPGTLAGSYARVSADGGQWRLASAVPISEYRRVLDEVRRTSSASDAR